MTKLTENELKLLKHITVESSFNRRRRTIMRKKKQQKLYDKLVEILDVLNDFEADSAELEELVKQTFKQNYKLWKTLW